MVVFGERNGVAVASMVPVTILLRLVVRCKVGDIGVKILLGFRDFDPERPGGGDAAPDLPPLLEGLPDGILANVGEIKGDSSSI